MILKNSFLIDIVFDAVVDYQTRITVVNRRILTFIVQRRQKKAKNTYWILEQYHFLLDPSEGIIMAFGAVAGDQTRVTHVTGRNTYNFRRYLDVFISLWDCAKITKTTLVKLV